MLNKRSTFTQNINNRKGQVALFIALAFQILFLFFAMVINVGLLVHHKINLQNSVDLAAYYGAMRQAENMNAIAHINYQIRQSWKLLAWRYRMLGTAGEWQKHPYIKQIPRHIDMNREADIIDTTDTVARNWQIAPAFCITYIPFKPMPPGENTCKYVAQNSPTVLWSAPPLIAAHQVFSGTIRATSEALRINATNRCKFFGSYNYVMLAKFIVAYNIDQGDRMSMIAALSRATSLAKDDFYDIDGYSVKAGVEKTLLNNLTSANRASARFDFFNSLGVDGCNAQNAGDDQPATWLKPIRIYPGFRYVDTECNGHAIIPRPKELTSDPSSFPIHKGDVPDLSAAIDQLKDFVGYRSELNSNYNFSLGVEKNPWCMAYTGVSATASPKIPFSPFGSVTLKARAFYKPFGGRMGPWYYKNWSRGSASSEGDPTDKTDTQVPPRVSDLAQLSTISEAAENNEVRVANFSRYIGDLVGLKSYKMLAYYGEAIYNLDSGWRGGGGEPSDPNSIYDGDDAPNFRHWDHLPFSFAEIGGSGDPLAWDSNANRPSKMRILETAAILPDNFDIAYYSIEPDFYHNYYTRIRDGYLRGPGKGFKKYFRPDLGYHKDAKVGSYDFEQFSVKDQFKIVNDPADVVDTKGRIHNQFTFTTEDWKNLLTSWAPKSLSDYSLDESKLGKCTIMPKGADDNNPSPPTPGNCISGATTGYSVKMVSSDYLRSSDLQLGGEGAGAGPLLNPPPPDSEF